MQYNTAVDVPFIRKIENDIRLRWYNLHINKRNVKIVNEDCMIYYKFKVKKTKIIIIKSLIYYHDFWS